MEINIRSANGALVKLDKKDYVELSDGKGNVAAVFFFLGDDVKVLQKGSAAAARYEKVFGVKFVPVVGAEARSLLARGA